MAANRLRGGATGRLRLPTIVVGLLLITAVVASCGSSSNATGTGTSAGPVDGPHETLTATFDLSGAAYEHAYAGSVCTASDTEPAFSQGASVVAKDADGGQGSVGFASLPAGHIRVGEIGRCSFSVAVPVHLGPQRYTLVVGTGNQFSVTVAQQDLLRIGGTSAASPAGDVAVQVVAR